MYLLKRYKPQNKKSPWALYGPGGLIALFTYKKGARAVLEILMERDKLRERSYGLLAIIMDNPTTEPARLDMVADK